MAGAVIYRTNPDDMSFDVYSYEPSVLTHGDTLNAAQRAFTDALHEFGEMQFKGIEYIEREIADGLSLRYPKGTLSNDVSFMRDTLAANAIDVIKQYGDFVTGTGDVTVVYATGRTKLGALLDQFSNREAIVIGTPIQIADDQYGVRTGLVGGSKAPTHESGSMTLKELGLTRRSTVLQMWAAFKKFDDDDLAMLGDGTIETHRQYVTA